MRQNRINLSLGEKPQYVLLNGLRGVAALFVILYHLGEAFATSPLDQFCNHGYLAVDFFFVLSGFVIGYAYDDRWKKMGVTTFFKRRLIRLHPMIIVACIIGVVSYLIQGSVKWDGTSVAFSTVMIAFVLNLFLIPSLPTTSTDIRGYGEMFPLNGPSWSLFFEYIANILYAIFLRRLPTKVLAVFVALTGGVLCWYALTKAGYGHIGEGWSLAGNQFYGGMLRVTFSYSAGLLISRIIKPMRWAKGAFIISSLGIGIIVFMPHLGGESATWINAIYDTACVVVFFPAILYFAASAKHIGSLMTKFCSFLGNLSYPLYLIHYPSMYLFYSLVWNNKYTFADVWVIAVAIVLFNIALAYLFLKFYDEPVRKYLSKKFS
ncbi:MAG: acyltransferase [Muribaculaceae bacterium]|nr:acyltransferase [Muribaculaceae bacterium]